MPSGQSAHASAVLGATDDGALDSHRKVGKEAVLARVIMPGIFILQGNGPAGAGAAQHAGSNTHAVAANKWYIWHSGAAV
jgi:hypothetical protein